MLYTMLFGISVQGSEGVNARADQPNDRGAVITLNMAEQNGHRRVEREQNDVQRVIDCGNLFSANIKSSASHLSIIWTTHLFGSMKATNGDKRAEQNEIAQLHTAAEAHAQEHEEKNDQTSELVKICFMLTYAKHISVLRVQNKINHPLHVVLLALHAAVPV